MRCLNFDFPFLSQISWGGCGGLDVPAPQDESLHRGDNPQTLPLLQQPPHGRDTAGYVWSVVGYGVSDVL